MCILCGLWKRAEESTEAMFNEKLVMMTTSAILLHYVTRNLKCARSSRLCSVNAQNIPHIQNILMSLFSSNITANSTCLAITAHHLWSSNKNITSQGAR